MSTSEITAYLLGADIRKAQADPDGSRVKLDRPIAESMTPDELAAWIQLGDKAFTYWIVRGANEARSWQG